MLTALNQLSLSFPPSLCRPAELFMNRLELDSACVANAVKLDANHMLVVYKQLEGIIERRIVQGPIIFVPEAYEWSVMGAFDY